MPKSVSVIPLWWAITDLAEQVGEVEVLPTSYLYDPTGKLVSYQEGTVTRASVESYIKSKSKKQQ